MLNETIGHRLSRGLDPGAIFSSFLFPTHGVVLVAVSGGSDSLALLLLFNAFIHRHAPGLTVRAVTIDHALRPDSAQEAASVGTLAERLGITHQVIRWNGQMPATGIQAAARMARYALLADAARAAGARFILTGHTEDDQHETVRMRLGRGTGRGLAGMAPATLLDGDIWLLRPLLSARKAELRALLAQAGVPWADDPSNNNPRFERTWMRREPEQGREAILVLRESWTAARERLGEAAAGLMMAHVDQPSPGLFRIAVPLLDADAALYTFRLLLASIGGRDQLPDHRRTEELFGRLRDRNGRWTLSGAVVDRRRAGLFLYRERRDIAGVEVESGAVFDNRLRVRSIAGTEGRGGFIVPAEPEASAGIATEVSGLPRSLVRAGFAAEPWFRSANGDTVPLERSGVSSKRLVAPFARFMPGFDHAPACALAALLGAPQPPALPLAAAQDRLP